MNNALIRDSLCHTQDVVFKSYQYGEGPPQRALTDDNSYKGISIERRYL